MSCKAKTKAVITVLATSSQVLGLIFFLDVMSFYIFLDLCLLGQTIWLLYFMSDLLTSTTQIWSQALSPSFSSLGRHIPCPFPLTPLQGCIFNICILSCPSFTVHTFISSFFSLAAKNIPWIFQGPHRITQDCLSLSHPGGTDRSMCNHHSQEIFVWNTDLLNFLL